MHMNGPITGAVIALFSAMCTGPVEAAVLGGKVRTEGSAQERTTVITLRCAPGERVAAVQFDLVFSGTLEAPPPVVQMGSASKSADKQVRSSRISSNTLRVIIAGLNQTPISGDEIATVSVSGALSSNAVMAIRNALLADPSGGRVPVNTEFDPAAPGIHAGREPLTVSQLDWTRTSLLLMAATLSVLVLVLRRKPNARP